MNDQPPFTLPDGSSNGNPPERCPRPLYSKTYRRHDDKISHRCKGTNQIQVEVKEEKGEPYMKSNERRKEEEFPSETITAGPSTRNTPGHSRDSSLEDPKNTRDYQGEDLFNIKVEVKEEAEEMYEKGDGSFKEEGIPPEISTDGHYMRNNWEKRPIISPEGELEDDGAFDSSEENPITPNVHPVIHNAELSSDPSTSGRSFPDHSPPATHHTPHRGLFKRRAAQMGKSSTRAGTSRRKRALASAALSSEDDEDEAGPPKKLGGGLRNIRFSHEENCVLVHTVIENWTSLYGAQSQKISFAQKKYLWQTVVSAVNAVSHYGRTVHHCKKRLSDIKRYLRTKLAAHKKYPRGTGASTPMDLKLTDYEEELLLVVGEEVMTGLEGAHLSTDRVEESEYIGSPEQLSPAPSLPEEEECRKDDLSENPAVYPDVENKRERHHMKGGQMPPVRRQNNGSREDTMTINLLPVDSTPITDIQLTSTNHRPSQDAAASPQLPSTNQMTTSGTYEDSIVSTLSDVVSKVERLNSQSRKEINRSHRLLNNIHTDLLLLKEELKVHREQQTEQSEKMIKLLEESNALKKIKLQLMREKIDLMRGQVPCTSSTALETPAPSPVKESTPPSLSTQMPKNLLESNTSLEGSRSTRELQL